MVRKILAGVLIIVAAAAAAFAGWGLTPPSPMEEAISALDSKQSVQVVTEPWIAFEPRQAPQTALVFYPGGRVDPRSYAPYASQLAEQGFLVVIVPMPLNLAVFSPDQAGEVIKAYPQISNWAVGGHSLGGAMAAAFAKNNPDLVKGLVLVASYPAENSSLAEKGIKVVSIYGTQDGLATVEKIDASRVLLPSDTVFFPVIGGNHAQFGWYGAQDGDRAATVSREDQQAQAVAATVTFLRSLEKD